MRLLRKGRGPVLSTRLLLGYKELSNIDRVLLQCSKTCVFIFSLHVSWQNARFRDIRSFALTTYRLIQQLYSSSRIRDSHLGSFTNISQRCFTHLLITITSEVNHRSGLSINPPCTAAAIM
jgi:hypothetical protein